MHENGEETIKPYFIFYDAILTSTAVSLQFVHRIKQETLLFIDNYKTVMLDHPLTMDK